LYTLVFQADFVPKYSSRRISSFPFSCYVGSAVCKGLMCRRDMYERAVHRFVSTLCCCKIVSMSISIQFPFQSLIKQETPLVSREFRGLDGHSPCLVLAADGFYLSSCNQTPPRPECTTPVWMIVGSGVTCRSLIMIRIPWRPGHEEIITTSICTQNSRSFRERLH
jgi:hypothetical protein